MAKGKKLCWIRSVRRALKLLVIRSSLVAWKVVYVAVFLYLCIDQIQRYKEMKDYKVIIAGSRKFSNYDKLKSECDRILKDKLENTETNVIIVSGAAKGADSLGEQYAHERGLRLESHPADWQKYNRSAGIIRNIEMAKEANALIAFPQKGEENRGTSHMVKTAQVHNLIVSIVM